MSRVIRLSKSCVGAEEALALKNVIEAEYLGMGDQVQYFENELKIILKHPLK